MAYSQTQSIDPDILDIVHLRRYTLGNAALEAELLSLFKAQIPPLMNKITSATIAAEWRLAVHTLKGSARAVGAVSIGDIAARIEEAGQSDEVNARDHLVKLLGSAIAEFTAESRKLVP